MARRTSSIQQVVSYEHIHSVIQYIEWPMVIDLIFVKKVVPMIGLKELPK